jgi:hypothetical protein
VFLKSLAAAMLSHLMAIRPASGYSFCGFSDNLFRTTGGACTRQPGRDGVREREREPRDTVEDSTKPGAVTATAPGLPASRSRQKILWYPLLYETYPWLL